MTLDFDLRLRAHALGAWLADQSTFAPVEVTPGIRSLQVQFDPVAYTSEAVVELLAHAEDELPPLDDVVVASRTVHLPLSWDDPATREAIETYMRVVRDDAPWCPWNIEFIRRINGLAVDRCRARHRVRRGVPRARARRRVPRRAGRGPGRPAPPAGHHEVQPGAHVDSRERGRHRRRVPLRLRHGGPGRLPVRGPHHPGVEHVRTRRRTRPRGTVAAPLLRPHPLVPGRRRRAARAAGRRARGPARAPHRGRHLLARRTPRVR